MGFISLLPLVPHDLYISYFSYEQMKTSWKAKKKWMHRVLRDLPTDSLSPLVQAENARTLARVSTLLSRGYTLTGSHGKAVHRRADALELYEEAGDRYAQTRHYEDAARMYRVVGLEDKANAVERTGEASLRQLRRDVLGTSTLVLLGGFMLLGLLVLSHYQSNLLQQQQQNSK